MATSDPHEQGRLLARPSRAPAGTARVGLFALEPDGYLYAPAGYQAGEPAPLALVLHGAGEDARDGLAQLRAQADGAGIILLACSSRGPTWDMILGRGRFGPDVAAIDRALENAFTRYAVDPARVAIGGYSDGGSYALSLGLANGDLFSHVLAFSPGFMMPLDPTGSPRFFVSHGIKDGWLPIERTSRRIVPQLERAGYEVRYREFEGGHVVPPGIAREAASWFARGG